MNKLAFLAAATLSVALMTGCSDDDEQQVPQLSINLENGVLNVSNEGETATVAYTLTHAAADGTMTATTTADWLTVTCENEAISVAAQPNMTTETKTATVDVTYTYAGSQTVSAQFDVQQAAMQVPDADYTLVNPYVAARLVSMMGIPSYNVYISQEEFPENLDDLPYNPDYIYYVIGFSQIGEDDKAVPGTYTLGEGTCSVAAYGTPDSPYYNAVEEGTLTLSYEGDHMLVKAEMTDGYGKTHFISYYGAPRYE